MLGECIIGVDPGVSGAIAAVGPDGRHLAHMLMPVVKVGTRSRVNGAAVSAFLRGIPGIRHVFIEQVGAMPGQGVTSMFTFGHSAGLVEGVVTGLGHPMTLVTPQAWKKRAGLIGLDKDAARSRAVQLFPGVRDLDLKGKGQAIADALLIARDGWMALAMGTFREEARDADRGL
ncbi:crossover junction endodeoxyribonuclease RuvC [Microcystis phage Mwe-JY08]